MNSSIKLLFASMLLAGAGSALGQSCAGMSLGANASLNGFVPFPADNAWNTDIASAPVDPNSDAITSAGGFAGLRLHPDFRAGSEYGIPYVVVDSTQTPSTTIHATSYATQSDVVVAPFPADAPIEGSPADCQGWPNVYVGDAHVLVLDRAKCVLYETFNTHRCNGQWEAASETMWDMTANESRPWGWTSGDAAGLPIFPGLVRYDEVASGAIHHAIRFTLKFTKADRNDGYFVAPATHAAGNLWGTRNVTGMRIRLKASFDISGFPKADQVILTAMKQYGMILADNGGSFFFQGVSDPRFDAGDLYKLSQVQSSNFEVVQTTPAYPGYDSGTAPRGPAPKISSFKASASSVKAGSAVTLSYDVSGDSYDYIDRIGPVAAGGGSVTIHPAATAAYTLFATNAYGRTASKPVLVTVPGSEVAPPVFAPPGGAYETQQKITAETPTSPAAKIHYTTDGTAPTANSPVFSIDHPITLTASEKLQAIAIADGYAEPSAIASADYVSLDPVATPVFSPPAGPYTSAQTVAIATATPSATIWYTLNGTAPSSASTQYTGPIDLERNSSIKAIAMAAGYANSKIALANYAITGSPTALAMQPTSVSASEATLNALVNTIGLPGFYHFEYGTSTTTLDTSTVGTALSKPFRPGPVSVLLTGLQTKQTYYFRVVVTTAGGTTTGAVLSFTCE